MKTLIVFMSRHGTTEKIVASMAQRLGEKDTTVVNLAHQAPPKLQPFDTILIGGSIHMGKIQKEVRKFCDDNMTLLLTKRTGLFLCFMNKEEGEKEFNNAFPAVLRAHSIARGMFGGELLVEKMKFMEKLAVRMVKGAKQSVSEINVDAIEEFIQKVR